MLVGSVAIVEALALDAHTEPDTNGVAVRRRG